MCSYHVKLSCWSTVTLWRRMFPSSMRLLLFERLHWRGFLERSPTVFHIGPIKYFLSEVTEETRVCHFNSWSEAAWLRVRPGCWCLIALGTYPPPPPPPQTPSQTVWTWNLCVYITALRHIQNATQPRRLIYWKNLFNCSSICILFCVLDYMLKGIGWLGDGQNHVRE